MSEGEPLREMVYKWRRQKLLEKPPKMVNDEQWFGAMAKRANEYLRQILLHRSSMLKVMEEKYRAEGRWEGG